MGRQWSEIAACHALVCICTLRLDLDRQIVALLDAGEDTGDLTGHQLAIENRAVTVPAATAQDVWTLLRMTGDEGNDTPRSTQDRLVGRAPVEAARAPKA